MVRVLCKHAGENRVTDFDKFLEKNKKQRRLFLQNDHMNAGTVRAGSIDVNPTHFQRLESEEGAFVVVQGLLGKDRGTRHALHEVVSRARS